MDAGLVEFGGTALAWQLPVLPDQRVRTLLAMAGSTDVAEGPQHARLKLTALLLGLAALRAEERLVIEATMSYGRRPDLAIMPQENGVPAVCLECGATPGNTIADHLRHGVAAVWVLPFALNAEPDDPLLVFDLRRTDVTRRPTPRCAELRHAWNQLQTS
ncbi:hypothetical protein [Falsiroseomonas oryzae]|uniref:hypothetical protein n=1 Tax=Falsiroseomonas oryzae TaxID=2766473 RepID=UPI0022EB7248|nr:hypothetical protein [Roseomonas sp. MO-31]